MQSDNITRKTCTICKEALPLDHFSPNRTRKDGLHGECKPCAKVRMQEWRKANAERWRQIANAAGRRWYQNHPEYFDSPEYKEKNRQRARRYASGEVGIIRKRKSLCKRHGLTLDRYRALWESQSGLCAICGKPELSKHQNGSQWNLCIDHDHRCCPGEQQACGTCVRGLLCNRCNRAIGWFGDDIQLIKNALKYLTRGPLL